MRSRSKEAHLPIEKNGRHARTISLSMVFGLCNFLYRLPLTNYVAYQIIYHFGQKIMNRGFAKTFIISILFVFTSIFISFPPSTALSSSPSREYETNICRGRLLADGEYFKAMSKALEGAKSEIVMSYFLFKTNGYKGSYPDMILSRLIAAAKRGVRVKIILERDTNRNSMINRNNRETAERLRMGGIEVIFDSPKTKTHTKVAVIDRRYVFIGSHNLTSSALKYNNELSFVIDSPQMARETLDYVNELGR